VSSPYEHEHLPDCTCPDCCGKVVPIRRQAKPGVPPAVKEELDRLKREWRVKSATETREAQEREDRMAGKTEEATT
jgi:hypothetical protein